MGHLQVEIRLDQLYYNAWSILGNRGGWGVPWSGFISGVVIGIMSSSFISMLMGTALMC